MTSTQPLPRYYDGPELVADVEAALVAAGVDLDAVTLRDLEALDQFHALGRPATMALAEVAEVRAGERILDVGAGIGGAARILAGRFGAEVTALEPTARFRRLAGSLNRLTGLGDAVEVVAGDGRELPFPDASFGLVWTQAVLQNVSELEGFAAEAHRVLVPGGRWALGEVVSGPGGALHFPVPWADRPQDSYVRESTALRAALEAPGFAAERWDVGGDAVGGAARIAAVDPPDRQPPVSLSLLMPDHDARMANVARNIAEGRVQLVVGLLRRGGPGPLGG